MWWTRASFPAVTTGSYCKAGPRRRGHTQGPSLGPAGSLRSQGSNVCELVPGSATARGGKVALGMRHQRPRAFTSCFGSQEGGCAGVKHLGASKGSQYVIGAQRAFRSVVEPFCSWFRDQPRAHQNPQRTSSSILQQQMGIRRRSWSVL